MGLFELNYFFLPTCLFFSVVIIAKNLYDFFLISLGF